MNTTEARLFIALFVSGDYYPQEHEAFLRWMEEAPLDELSMVIGEYEALRDSWPSGSRPNIAWVEQMEQKLDLADTKEEVMPVRRLYPVRPPVKKFSWLAAASVSLLIVGGGIGAYWYANRPGPAKGSSVNQTETLSILSVPRGQQQELDLADGSKVWLNAASTLRYPSSFTGKERVVELSGEALFEIAPNAALPFRVRSRDMEVEVLGTRFNMMAYEEEKLTRTTLLEGSLKIIRGTETVILHPGDQAEADLSQESSAAGIRVTHGIDEDLALAWRTGMRFERNDLQTVMREIARRYDLDVQYEGQIPRRFFTGKFSSGEDINQILKILELQHVHFKITGKRITVMP